MSKKLELIGEIGVDSGLVQLGDPGYYWHDEFVEMRKAWDENDINYWKDFHSDGENVHVFLLTPSADSAVIVQSGYGDGIYPVYAEFTEEGRVKSLHVYFIDDEIDNDEDEV